MAGGCRREMWYSHEIARNSTIMGSFCVAGSAILCIFSFLFTKFAFAAKDEKRVGFVTPKKLRRILAGGALEQILAIRADSRN